MVYRILYIVLILCLITFINPNNAPAPIIDPMFVGFITEDLELDYDSYIWGYSNIHYAWDNHTFDFVDYPFGVWVISLYDTLNKWMTVTTSHPQYDTAYHTVIARSGLDVILVEATLEPKCSYEYSVKMITYDSTSGSEPYYMIRFYNSIQQAYDNALGNDIMLVGNFQFFENIVFDRDVSISIQGGYDCKFQEIEGISEVGSIHMLAGKVTMNNFKLSNTL